jgi:hypothetical protein
MVQLLAEWEEISNQCVVPLDCIPDDMTLQDMIEEWKKSPLIIVKKLPEESVQMNNCRIGLPKLPSNISPVPEDLNDLIARVKGISVREAFDLNREEMVKEKLTCKYIQSGQHNALFDADVIE